MASAPHPAPGSRPLGLMRSRTTTAASPLGRVRRWRRFSSDERRRRAAEASVDEAIEKLGWDVR